MSLLPERCSQDQVVEVPFPTMTIVALAVVVVKVEAFAAYIEGGEVVPARGLDLEGCRMGANMCRNVLRCCGSHLSELGLVGRYTVQLGNDGKRDEDGPFVAFNERNNRLKGREKNIGIDDQDCVARRNVNERASWSC